MTVIKQFGKNASPSLSFGGNDSAVHNTNRGNSVTGVGFNIPNENGSTWDGKAIFSHTDFWGEEPTIKISEDWAFSCKHRAELRFPRISAAGAITKRAQYETIRNQTRIAFGFPVYFPTGHNPQYLRRQILQRWGGSGSPGFDIVLDFRETDRDWISFKLSKGGSNSDLIYCPIIKVQYDTWYHIVGFCDFRNDNQGRMTVWLDTELARIHPRIGTGDGVAVYSKVPVNQNGTGSYQTNPALGKFLSGTVEEDGGEMTLFDWEGYNVMPTNNPSNGQWNWGFYAGASSVSDMYHPQATITANLADFPATKTWDECVLVNPDNPNGSNYEHPDYRTVEYFSNFTLAIWGAGQTDEDVFREVHPLGLAPLEFPVGSEAWPNGFISNQVIVSGDAVIPAITSEATLTNEVPVYEITGHALLPEITSEALMTNGDPANNITGDIMIPAITSEAVIEQTVPVFSITAHALLPEITSTASLSTEEDLTWRLPFPGKSWKRFKKK